MIMEYYGFFLWVISLPALSIFVGIELLIALVKYFKKKNESVSVVGTAENESKVSKYIRTAVIHAVATLLSPAPAGITALMLLPAAMLLPAELWALEVLITVGFIFLLAKLIGWLAKPLNLTFSLPAR